MRFPLNHRARNRGRLIAAAAVLVPAHLAMADANWVGGTSNWSASDNWSPTGVPMSGTVYAANSGPVPQIINYDFTGSNALDLLSVSGTTAPSIVSMPAYNLTATDQNVDRFGIFNQSGGTNTVSELIVTGSGTSAGLYALSNGDLSSSSESIGSDGPGNFNQSGGTHEVSGELLLGSGPGSTSTYTLSGNGSLTDYDHEALGNGGNAIFNQSGGSNSLQAAASLYVGYLSSGTYLLSNTGSLAVDNSEFVGLYAPGTFNQTGGTHTVNGNLKIGSFGQPGSYSLSGTAQLTVNGQLTVGSAGSFNQTGGSVTLSPHGSTYAADVISSLSISSNSKFDIGNNAIDLPLANLSTLNTLVQQGAILSSTAATDTTHLTAIGILQNNQSGSALFNSQNQFDGISPNATDVLLKYTYFGDTNLDGKVDGTDYSRIDAAYIADKSNALASTGWFNGDFNYDGHIDGSDYTLIDNAFNSQGTQLTAEIVRPTAITTNQIAGDSPVPEPTICLTITIAAIGLLTRRKNRTATQGASTLGVQSPHDQSSISADT